MIRRVGMCLSMFMVLRRVRTKMSVLTMIVLIKCVVHSMFMEVNWLNIVLVIKSVIKYMMVLMFFTVTLLMLMANLGIMIGIIVVGIMIAFIVVSITMAIIVVKVSIKTKTSMVHWCMLIVLFCVFIRLWLEGVGN